MIGQSAGAPAERPNRELRIIRRVLDDQDAPRLAHEPFRKSAEGRSFKTSQ